MTDLVYDMIARREGKPTKAELRFREIEAKIAEVGKMGLTSEELTFYNYNRCYYVNDKYAYKPPAPTNGSDRPRFVEPEYKPEVAPDPYEETKYNGMPSNTMYWCMKNFYGF